MDKIVEGIFTVDRDHKQKVVLITTLKPHILKQNHETANKILANSISRLEDKDGNIRNLAVTVINILYRIIPESTIVSLTKVDTDQSEYHVLCSTLIVKSLTNHRLISFNQVRRVCDLIANNKMLKFKEEEYKFIVNVLPQVKQGFTDLHIWADVYFHYCSFIDEECTLSSDLLHVNDQSVLVNILKRIGMELSEGNLSYSQGKILSSIEDTTTVNTACREFVRNLPENMLTKCFNNLISLQIRGLVLSHWILSLINILCTSCRYLLVIQLAERYVDILIHQKDEDSIKLICNLLLLHQHSPVLFHRYYLKLEQLNNQLTFDYLRQTIQTLMIRFPHYHRLYNGKTIPHSIQWSSLHKHLSKSKLKFHHGVGFNNLGNTCYFNSLLQALWLSSTFQYDVVFNQVDSSILRELRRVFLNLSYSIRGSFSPDTLFHVIRPSWFTFGSQQDAAELLRHLFDLISSGTGQRTNNGNNSSNSNSLGSSGSLLGGRDFSVESSKYNRRYCASAKLDTAEESLPSQIIVKHFEGVQESTITCKSCNNSSSKPEKFLFLPIPCLPDSKQADIDTNRPSLSDLISDTLTTEQMIQDNQYSCDTCATKTDAVRNTTLSRLPKTFIFTLNRFSYDKVLKCRSKLLTNVQIPSELKFQQTNTSGFVLSNTGTVTYKLYAVVVHSGSTTESGHYFTYGVSSDMSTDILSNCLCFDDSTVSYIDKDMINNPTRDIQTPYLLFYQRETSNEQVMHHSNMDLDIPSISDILNNNIRYLELQQSKQREVSDRVKSADDKGGDKGGDKDSGDDNSRYIGSCHSNDFAAGSSRFIY